MTDDYAEAGFTDEECPAWNHSDDEGFDQYVVCLRCDHFQDDCPHECGPEFNLYDVADCLEEQRRLIPAQQERIERLTTERNWLADVCHAFAHLIDPDNIATSLAGSKQPYTAVEFVAAAEEAINRD